MKNDRSLVRFLLIILLTASSGVRAALPITEQLAPGVFAAGFSARYDSANCGWVALKNETLLIDLPRGVALPEFLSEIEKTTGKPARSLIWTQTPATDDPLFRALRERGVRVIATELGGENYGDSETPVRFVRERENDGPAGGAVYLPAARVLFAGPACVNGPRLQLPGRDTAACLRTLEEWQKLGAARVVPGNGSWGASQILERQKRFLIELRRQIAYGITMGVPLDRIEKSIVMPSVFSVWTPYDTPTVEDIRWVYGELTVPMAPYRGRPPEIGSPQPHALVLIGDRFHEPEHLESGLRPVFEGAGVIPHFLVDFHGLTAANLSRVKLLVILRDGYIWPEGKGVSWMTLEQQEAVVRFVENGGAFLNLHNSMGLYPDNGPYLKLVGGRYIGHGPLERFTTEVVDPSHPITRGVTNFFTADEQHTPPYETNKVYLLLRNRSDDGKTVAAAGWAYEPGRGRVCHLANGHTREALEHPMFQRLMRNAVNWLLRREP